MNLAEASGGELRHSCDTAATSATDGKEENDGV